MATEEEITRLRLDPQREKHEARQRAEKYSQETEEDMVRLNLDQDRQAYQLQLQAEQEEREPYSTKPPEKMGLMFFVIGLFFSVIGDVIDFFTAGTFGWLVGLFIDAILLLMFGLSKSGRKQFKRVVIAVLGESIPVINMLPFRSIIMIWSFIKSRNKIARKVTSTAKAVT